MRRLVLALFRLLMWTPRLLLLVLELVVPLVVFEVLQPLVVNLLIQFLAIMHALFVMLLIIACLPVLFRFASIADSAVLAIINLIVPRTLPAEILFLIPLLLLLRLLLLLLPLLR